MSDEEGNEVHFASMLHLTWRFEEIRERFATQAKSFCHETSELIGQHIGVYEKSFNNWLEPREFLFSWPL